LVVLAAISEEHSMRKIIYVAVVALCSASCSRQQSGNQDFVSYEVDPIAIGPADVQPKADAHCAKWGKRAVLVDFTGTFMTFNCVARPTP
jgi:hypothetical protein